MANFSISTFTQLLQTASLIGTGVNSATKCFSSPEVDLSLMLSTQPSDTGMRTQGVSTCELQAFHLYIQKLEDMKTLRKYFTKHP